MKYQAVGKMAWSILTNHVMLISKKKKSDYKQLAYKFKIVKAKHEILETKWVNQVKIDQNFSTSKATAKM